MSQVFKRYRENNNYKDYEIRSMFQEAIYALEKNNKKSRMINHQLKANSRSYRAS